MPVFARYQEGLNHFSPMKVASIIIEFTEPEVEAAPIRYQGLHSDCEVLHQDERRILFLAAELSISDTLRKTEPRVSSAESSRWMRSSRSCPAGATFPFARGVGCETLTPRFVIYYIHLNRCFGDLSERGILKFSTVCEDNEYSSQLERNREMSTGLALLLLVTVLQKK